MYWLNSTFVDLLLLQNPKIPFCAPSKVHTSDIKRLGIRKEDHLPWCLVIFAVYFSKAVTRAFLMMMSSYREVMEQL